MNEEKWVFTHSHYTGVLDREKKLTSVSVSGVQALNVLVENMGHLNFGAQIVGDSKGAVLFEFTKYSITYSVIVQIMNKLQSMYSTRISYSYSIRVHTVPNYEQYEVHVLACVIQRDMYTLYKYLRSYCRHCLERDAWQRGAHWLAARALWGRGGVRPPVSGSWLVARALPRPLPAGRPEICEVALVCIECRAPPWKPQ